MRGRRATTALLPLLPRLEPVEGVLDAAVALDASVDMADSSASSQAADAVLFQRWLHSRQYPSDCSKSVGVLTRTGLQPDGREYPGNYFFGLGLGSQMVSLKFNFARALLKNQVYHFPSTHYANPLRCPSRSFDCYFEAPTHCTLPSTTLDAGPVRPRVATDHASVSTERLLWCFELPRRRLSKLAGLSAVHAQGWYHAQLSAFLFRPSATVRAYRDRVLPRLTVAPAPAPGGGGGGAAHNGSCVAMHIRRTDKQKGKRKEDTCPLRPFDYFARQFRTWSYWESPKPAAQLRVLLGSEDKATFGAMPPLLAPTPSYWIPGDEFVMEGFKDIVDHNERLTKRYADLVERMAAAKAAGGAAVAALEAEPPSQRDEGEALVLQMLLMGECEALFGSYASNVAILVRDLMHARMVAQHRPLHVVDACGRTYCGCGASFCMKLERRSGREPTRTMHNMVEVMRGDNRNAI